MLELLLLLAVAAVANCGIVALGRNLVSRVPDGRRVVAFKLSHQHNAGTGGETRLLASSAPAGGFQDLVGLRWGG